MTLKEALQDYVIDEVVTFDGYNYHSVDMRKILANPEQYYLRTGKIKINTRAPSRYSEDTRGTYFVLD